MSGRRRAGPPEKPARTRASGAGRATSRGGAATETPLTPGSRASRRAVREQHQKSQRRRLIIVGISIVAVVAVVLAALWWLSRDDEAPPPVVTGERTAASLTLTLAAEGDPATSGVLLVADAPQDSADGVMIPSRVFVTGPAPEGVPFGETVLLDAVDAPGASVANTLNVIVDGTWQLSPKSLAALVDSVGGVLVDVDVDVLAGDKGKRSIVLAAGDGQLLDGEQASAYSQFLAPGEPEDARLARFSQVVDQLMRRLPQSPEDVQTLVTEDRADELVSVEVPRLADFLVDFGDVARTGGARFQILPTQPLPVPGGQDASTPDPAGVEQLRETVLSGIVPDDVSGEQITVLVQNGVGTPGIDQDAAELLTADGYQFINGGNATSFDFKETVVLIPDSTSASVALGNSVAEVLGVPPATAVKTTDQGSSFADVIVILGEDFGS